MQNKTDDLDLNKRNLNRWRLILGNFAEDNLKVDGEYFEIDETLNFLYDREYSENNGYSLNNLNDLNNSNILTENVASNIVSNSTWYLGNITESLDHSFISLKSIEKQSKIQSDIALLSATEYIEASLDPNCEIDYINTCLNNNYLNFNKNYWLINSSEKKLTKIDSGNILEEENSLNVLYIYPVIYLNYGIQIKGSGTSNDPYTIY